MQCCNVNYINDEKYCHQCGKELFSDDPWMTFKDLIKYFNGSKSREQLYRLIRIGEIKVHRDAPKGKVYIRRSWISNYENKNVSNYKPKAYK